MELYINCVKCSAWQVVYIMSKQWDGRIYLIWYTKGLIFKRWGKYLYGVNHIRKNILRPFGHRRARILSLNHWTPSRYLSVVFIMCSINMLLTLAPNNPSLVIQCFKISGYGLEIVNSYHIALFCNSFQGSSNHVINIKHFNWRKFNDLYRLSKPVRHVRPQLLKCFFYAVGIKAEHIREIF